MDPVSSLIGSLLLGGGTVLLYGAIKNRRVFGEDGIVTVALTKGRLVDLSEIPAAFGDSVGMAMGSAGGGRAGKIATRLPAAVNDALKAIEAVNAPLANNLTWQLHQLDSDSTRAEVMPVAQLLGIADRRGLTVPTAAIRAYVKDLTGESI